MASVAHARIREDMLREAQKRLDTWYNDKDTLELPWYRDGATLQITKKTGLCDAPGSSLTVPVTFGEFLVEGVRPVDVFNALVDVDQQSSWDSTIGQMNKLGDFRDEGVRGLEVTYPAGVPLIADREVFEWTAFNASLETEEFWSVFTTQGNARLHAKMERTDGAVAAQNCLGAYRVVRAADGARVRFTQQINVHQPGFISAQTVFDVSWSKQVDFFNALGQRARVIHSQGAKKTELALPNWLLQGPPMLSTAQAANAEESRISWFTKQSDLQVQVLYEVGSSLRRKVSLMGAKQKSGIFIAGFAAFAASLTFFWRCAFRAPHWEQLLQADEQPIESAA